MLSLKLESKLLQFFLKKKPLAFTVSKKSNKKATNPAVFCWDSMSIIVFLFCLDLHTFFFGDELYFFHTRVSFLFSLQRKNNWHKRKSLHSVVVISIFFPSLFLASQFIDKEKSTGKKTKQRNRIDNGLIHEWWGHGRLSRFLPFLSLSFSQNDNVIYVGRKEGICTVGFWKKNQLLFL